MSRTERLGGHAFNHGSSGGAEQEYDRLRDLARKEQGQHQSFASRSQQAYQSGDGGQAHELSQQSKAHAAKADEYNKQASEFIFRENNSMGKVDSDTIDLHGQFVEEAEEILEQRIRYAQQNGQSHLHVIVGKGNHSANHVQKIKPRVEQICRELGLQYNTEHNEGRIYVELKPGGSGPPQMPQYDYGKQHQPQHAQYGQPHHTTAYPMSGGYPGQQQQMQYGGQQQQQQQQHHQPQQQMGYQEPEQQKDDGIKICGIKICVVM